jgi:hypothetical protein
MDRMFGEGERSRKALTYVCKIESQTTEVLRLSARNAELQLPFCQNKATAYCLLTLVDSTNWRAAGAISIRKLPQTPHSRIRRINFALVDVH